MSGLKKHTDATWERFFEFLFPCDEILTQEEMLADLKKLGISVDKAMNKVRFALVAAKGKAELANARAQRLSMVDRLSQVAGAVGENLRERLHAIIAGQPQAAVQAAYFKKLEKAATEEDLQSLFDDIRRLDSFTEEAGGKP